MGKIRELSEQLANQIAAGEVVERPASVVKELVENAIDAGSTQIDIFIEEAGLKTIQVIDNGDGIAKEDVVNAFKRHATSKIHTRDDLFRIRSLGFRGEALPSIASVSELTIETAVAEEAEGSYARLVGGKVEEHRPGALRKGTKITVENLFFNTPARLKYVKTIQTELATVGDIVNRLALSHPNIAFRVVHDGNKMMSTAGNGDLKQTIAGIYGIGTAKKMLEIHAKDLDFEVKGYVSLPEVTRASRNYLSTIINGRYVKNFVLNKAIVNGYGSKLMVGRFPIAVIEITMDPLLVDVNVHPTKQEVRLSKEKELMGLISEAIEEALSQEQLIPNAAANLKFKQKVAQQPQVEQMEIPLGEDQPAAQTGGTVRQPGSLQYDSQSGRFFVETPEAATGTASSKTAGAAENKEMSRGEDGHANEPAAEGVGHDAPEPHERSAKEAAPHATTETEAVDSFDQKSSDVKTGYLIQEDNAEGYSAAGGSTTAPPPSEVQGNGKGVAMAEAENQASRLSNDHTHSQAHQSELGGLPQDTRGPDSSLFSEEARNHPDFEMSSKENVKELNRTMERLEHEKKTERFPELEYFGQMHGTYLFAQSKQGLYVIDQHAAQERIKYEYFREKIGEVSNDLQELLVPIVLDYPNSDALAIGEQKEQLESVGIFLEEFGQNSFIVRAHPTWYPAGEEESIIREMIDMLLMTGQVSVKKFREATAIMMSCKRSIKANHYLNDQQARILLADLAQCANPFNCPHGRPVLIHFTNSDMEKMFKRIQDPH